MHARLAPEIMAVNVLILPRVGQCPGWTVPRVDSSQGGQCPGWTVPRVDSAQGGPCILWCPEKLVHVKTTFLLW